MVGGLGLGLLIAWGASLANMNEPVRIDSDSFLIDYSHMPASGHYEARVNPVGPLYTNLLRSGFRIFEQDAWDPRAIARARGIAFVAPQRTFSGKEVEELMAAEEQGAIVLLAVGQPDSAGARPLLEAHGLALDPRPLGTVSDVGLRASRVEREQQPRFFDAWPIVAAGGGSVDSLSDVEVIYRRGDDTLALFRRRGRGGLLLFADTRFFSDMNIEDVSGYWLGNLALIHDVFQRHLGANPDAVRPVFRSPEKPR